MKITRTHDLSIYTKEQKGLVKDSFKMIENLIRCKISNWGGGRDHLVLQILAQPLVLFHHI